mgnify:CR=1 FL=1
MKEPIDINTVDNQFVRDSYTALVRASQIARDIAIQSNTCLIVRRNGKLVKIPPEELIAERKRQKTMVPDAEVS